MNQVINIYLDRPFTPKVWTQEERLEDSVFGQLEEVLEKIYEITEDRGSDYKFGSDEYDSLEKQYERQNVGEHNNIISIVGNRGTGKSSILRSIPNLFTQSGKVFTPIEKNTEGLKNESKVLRQLSEKGHQFLTLPVTDPNSFKKNDSIMEAFVSRLYTIFENELNKEQPRKTNKEKQQKLVKAFKKVRNSLQASRLDVAKVLGDNPMEPNFGDLEALEHLAAGVSLRTYVTKLVYAFLEWWFEGESGKKKYIIVSIDDLDLFTGDIIQVVEDIRNLVQIPGLIVVTALRIEQLAEEIEVYFLKRYNVNKEEFHLSETANQIAGKYIAKLFPISKRIYTLDFREIEGKVRFHYKTSKLSNLAANDKDLANSLIFDSFQDCIGKLFFAVSGIVLIDDNLIKQVHPIVFSNFREYVHTVAYLVGLNVIYPNFIEDKMLDQTQRDLFKENINNLNNIFFDNYLIPKANAFIKELFNKINKANTIEWNKIIITSIVEGIQNKDSFLDLEAKNNYIRKDEPVESVTSLIQKYFTLDFRIYNNIDSKKESRLFGYVNNDSYRFDPKYKIIRAIDLISKNRKSNEISLSDLVYFLKSLESTFDKVSEFKQITNYVLLKYSLIFSLNKYKNEERNNKRLDFIGTGIVDPMMFNGVNYDFQGSLIYSNGEHITDIKNEIYKAIDEVIDSYDDSFKPLLLYPYSIAIEEKNNEYIANYSHLQYILFNLVINEFTGQSNIENKHNSNQIFLELVRLNNNNKPSLKEIVSKIKSKISLNFRIQIENLTVINFKKPILTAIYHDQSDKKTPIQLTSYLDGVSLAYMREEYAILFKVNHLPNLFENGNRYSQSFYYISYLEAIKNVINIHGNYWLHLDEVSFEFDNSTLRLQIEEYYNRYGLYILPINSVEYFFHTLNSMPPQNLYYNKLDKKTLGNGYFVANSYINTFMNSLFESFRLFYQASLKSNFYIDYFKEDHMYSRTISNINKYYVPNF